LIETDSCGSIGQNSPRRRTLSGSYTPATTGLYTLEFRNYRGAWQNDDIVNYIDNIKLSPANPDLLISSDNISISSAGSVDLTLDAGASHAGEDYFLLASFGTHPGLDVYGHHIPLNDDVLFDYSKTHANSSIFQNTKGVLDASGSATARFSTPGAMGSTYLGTTMSFAYVLLSAPATPPVTYASQQVMVNYIP